LIDSILTRPNASLTIGTKGMTPFGSIPQDDVTISFGEQSTIQFASSAGANPPNTTE